VAVMTTKDEIEDSYKPLHKCSYLTGQLRLQRQFHRMPLTTHHGMQYFFRPTEGWLIPNPFEVAGVDTESR